MKVRMLTHIAGKPAYHQGQIVDLEPRIAKAWAEDGICVLLTVEQAIERAIESERGEQR